MGLLAAGLTLAVTAPGSARPDASRGRTTLATRLAPPVVTAGEPAAIVSQLSPAQAGRPVTVQQLSGGTWTPVADARSRGSGRTVVTVDTSTPGQRVFRVVAPAWAGKPQVVARQVTLLVTAADDCRPEVALVDPAATTAARCLAARLDNWHSAALLGVGQQLNVSNEKFLDPLDRLGNRRVAVVGFDLQELAEGQTYGFSTPPLDALTTLASEGAVLTASWHASNPHSGLTSNDTSWHSVSDLFDPTTAEYASFWADADAKIELLRQLQDAGVAVVFRPLHEANGGWFWWGHATPSQYRRLYSMLQDRTWAAGVHNVVWAYSFNARSTSQIADPVPLIPDAVDLAGIDTYWPAGGSHRSQAPSMSGYSAVAATVHRMALTEIGPYADTKRSWRPSVVTATARSQSRRPVWALLWFDDRKGLKQISSLKGGLSWLDSCPFGFCTL